MTNFQSTRRGKITDLYWLLEIEDIEWSTSDFENELNISQDEGLFIVDKEQRGFCCIRKMDDNLELLNIGVSKKFRSQGIGKMLLVNTIDIAIKKWNCNKIFLEFKNNNEKAKKLYYSLGFSPINIRKNYYKDNTDAIVASLELGESENVISD